ncbi:MAG TPA: hypothetical protein VG104_03410 [Candidatus Dormibacteraeota bacterium]|jgi:uncharacterized protein YdeI (YjbR/CyaY-like superfamily)|nr:hypothetical protein [Candidatus Dormibacteraeota bacterium]
MDVGETLAVRTPAEWRRWLARYGQKKKEIWVVYYKKNAGQSGISYDESVEEALAYGWIDGQNKTIDDKTYAGRFTPRKPNSNWSASNIARLKKLLAEGRMAEPGLAVIPPELKKHLPHSASSLPLVGRAREGVP